VVKKPMPDLLTVERLREFLSECQPQALVGTRLTREMIEQLDDITSKAPEMTLIVALEIASEAGRPTVMLRLKLDDPEQSAP
jgi:hypothetical protein